MTVDTEHEKTSKNYFKEVIIYECGNPVLKIESGTTLKVVKLLYGAEHEKKRRQILGVRPKQCAEGIPCIVTLDESKLNELTYDILLTEEIQEQNDCSSNKETTNRCLDCSRESWKTKRFTNIGMNTEISVNPFTELDAGKLSTDNISPTSNTSIHEKQRSRTSSGQLTQSPSPRVTALYPNTSQTDCIGARSISHHNNKSSNGVENERDHHRSPSSPTYGMEAYSLHNATQIRYPTQPHLDPIHYEHLVPSHSWIDPTHYIHSPRSDHVSPSPLHRSRSPLSPRSMDIKDSYHFHRNHDKQRHILHPAHYERRIHRDERLNRHYDVRIEESIVHTKPAFQHTEPHIRERTPNLIEFTSNDKHPRPLQQQPPEEPPVFVLPNDFDGIDPREVNMQERRSVKYPTPPQNERENEGSKIKSSNSPGQQVKEEFQNSANNSNESFSPKSGNEGVESPDSSTNSSQKLYCKICNSVFPTKSMLYKHLRGHTSDEKPFKCSECGQGFTLSSNLRQHRIIHRGYKPFQCEFCGKKFMRSNVYKQHRRIHTGEEMHKCGLCPSEFLQKYALLKHMKKNHDVDALDN